MTSLIGRDAELARIRPGTSALIVGGRGTGRSAVLTEAAHGQGADGVTVLATRALPGDEALPGAALQRLLGPIHDRAPEIFGATELVDAVCALAQQLSQEGRWLWCVDDLDRIDDLSRTAILSQRHIPVLATALTAGDLQWPRVVRLGRLSPADAERLLAGLPGVRSHPAARLLLAQAAGNPLALTELARELPGIEPSVSRTELPVPLRLRRALAPGVDTLDPVRLRAALLAAFATETPARPVAAALDVLVAPDVWEWLVADGVLRPGRARRFTHPVVRAAVIEQAGFVLSRDARHQLAALLPAGCPARAWQAARADPTPDDTIAQILDRTGTELTGAGRLRAAAYAFTLAADQSTDPAAAHDRRLRAARCAHLVGEPEWGRLLAADLPPAERAESGGSVGLPTLLRLAWMRGDDQALDAVRETVSADADEFAVVWARAMVDDTDPGGAVQRLLNQPERPGRAGSPPDQRALALGTMALARHETTLARKHLSRALALATPGSLNHRFALCGLSTVAYDAGELDTAVDYARQVIEVTARDRNISVVDDVRAGVRSALAAVAALREDPQRERWLSEARDEIQPGRHAIYALRVDRAQGLIDGIRGRHGLALHRMRRHYDADGNPVHHRVSDLVLADLAGVAVAQGRGDEVAPIVEAAEARVRALRSVRITALWNRAKALLAGADEGAESFFRLALADPGTDQWPFERALARMDYAQWLRRRHRPGEARPLLVAARDVFAAAGLNAWRERADAELDAADPPRRTGVIAAGLTPQQRRVVTLAAKGLTNPQIAERLGLSARTVGTHLSRAYPILGVTRRSQLPGVVDLL